ncbi:MAG TPA: hypothetical protein DCQ76_02115 [Ruminococcaceae bacterium]|jgi:hypothetical protein|nr:hypothetical protein [Oscillospiraceae bacterium]
MKKFDVDTCTTEELFKRCQALRFSAQNVSLAVNFFILKTPHKSLADKFCIDEKSVTMRKWRMKKILNT